MHFNAFVHVNGGLWEMDGRKKTPIYHVWMAFTCACCVLRVPALSPQFAVILRIPAGSSLRLRSVSLLRSVCLLGPCACAQGKTTQEKLLADAVKVIAAVSRCLCLRRGLSVRCRVSAELLSLCPPRFLATATLLADHAAAPLTLADRVAVVRSLPVRSSCRATPRTCGSTSWRWRRTWTPSTDTDCDIDCTR